MATLRFIERQAEILVSAFGLTLKDSEEELKNAIKTSFLGFCPKEAIEIDFCGEKYTHKAGKLIFPRYVYTPQENCEEIRWTEDHAWGDGPNESEEIILSFVKAKVLYRSSAYLFSWETARRLSQSNQLEEFACGLSNISSMRGPGSPYSQDRDKEVDLAIEFGIETILKWHSSMHWKNWAEFIENIYQLWKRWGASAIQEIGVTAGSNIQWFARYATTNYSNGWIIPQEWDHRRALRAWKRARWIYAITKIDDQYLTRIDKKYGRQKIDIMIRGYKDQIISLPEDFRRHALECLAIGDTDIEWLSNSLINDDEVRSIINIADKNSLKPSVASIMIERLMKDAGLDFNQVSFLIEKLGWNNTINYHFLPSFQKIPSENRHWAIFLHYTNDSISWLEGKFTPHDIRSMVEWSIRLNLRPSVFAEQISIFKSAGINWSEIDYYILGKGDIFEWDRKVQLIQKAEKKISPIIYTRRIRGFELLMKNEERNTRWWSQAIDNDEFDAGVAAEQINREGLEGIQRLRWLKDRLGLSWTPKVDEKLSWEESSEIIQKNPWLKTTLSFVDREETILSIAVGQEMTYLKYVATREEYGFVTGKNYRLEKILEVIKNSWPEDVRGWFIKLSEAIGEHLTWDYIGNRTRHDQLFFVDTMLKKLPVETLRILLPQVRGDYERLAPAINAYEPDGKRFESFKEFIKYVELQKNQIVFPDGCPEILREKVGQMLEAPGVSVSAIREFIRNRDNWPFIAGHLDKKALFPAKKIELFSDSLPNIVQCALGSKKTCGKAEKPGLLFKRLNVLAQRSGLKSAAELTKHIPEEIEKEVIVLLQEHKVQLGDVYTAEVVAKSNPYGWTCGDWTSCCMEFGSEKNNEYMQRRDMGYFIISLNGRPIAQSVVVAAAHESRNGSTPSVEAATFDNIDAIALDNVEVAPNFTGHNSMINAAYRIFWERYGNGHVVIVGTSHNDTTPIHETRTMEWKPLTKMVYSDCFGKSSCYVLREPKKTKNRKGEK